VHTLFVLQNIFREIFDDPQLTITPATSPRDIPIWDSVAQVQLILAVEEHFDVRFTTDEVASLKCVGDYVASIQRHSGVLA
jgi:acyl carrier protein